MTPDTEMVENSDATFSVYTAPRSDDGAFVLVASTSAEALDHCIALIHHYGLTKDIAGTWGVRVFEGQHDVKVQLTGTYDSSAAAHQWIAYRYRQTNAPTRSIP